MGASRTSFAKLQRDRAKKAKAAAKRERRLDKDGELIEGDELVETELIDDGEELSADQLLKLVEELHADFEAKRIDFETFEERKTELFARISVD
jgi:hypothetical protein